MASVSVQSESSRGNLEEVRSDIAGFNRLETGYNVEVGDKTTERNGFNWT